MDKTDKKAGQKKAYFYAEKDMLKSILLIPERIGTVESIATTAKIPAIINRLSTHEMSDENEKKREILKDHPRDMQQFDQMLLEWKER